ncbi:MAG: DMT family transporter [Candidatus Caldarchaeum sp.]|jgi:transporter family protein|uniref:EamA family transporter n=1 Tax=Caldiarchaeum subterraneum TaxID=311458 RepID=A0A7C4I0M1_CALS0|nr:DMT family transporter [Candidatus Caldarchaeales archaeon]
MELRWVAVVLLTLFIWGLWGVLARVGASALGWRDSAAVAAIGHMIVSLMFIISSRAQVIPASQAWFAALLAGVLGFLGAVTFYLALDLNPSSIVVVATSLYPLVTLILSYLLFNEVLTLRQVIGAALALIALALISGE